MISTRTRTTHTATNTKEREERAREEKTSHNDKRHTEKFTDEFILDSVYLSNSVYYLVEAQQSLYSCKFPAKNSNWNEPEITRDES